MDNEYFFNKLVEERNNIIDNIESLTSDIKDTGEISFYDNHPADTASEVFEKEKDTLLKNNEEGTLKKIDNAIKRVENGTYGICEKCNSEIPKERLEVIPYATRCVKCEEESPKFTSINTPPSSKRIGDDFDLVNKFNRRENIYEELDGKNTFQDEISNISNEEYKNTLS